LADFSLFACLFFCLPPKKHGRKRLFRCSFNALAGWKERRKAPHYRVRMRKDRGRMESHTFSEKPARSMPFLFV
jgi:hypothetical protein